MKQKKMLSWLLAAVLIIGLCAGCDLPSATKSEDAATEPAESELSTQEKETAAAENPEQNPQAPVEDPTETVNYAALYAPLLDKTYYYLLKQYDDGENSDVPSGVIEEAMWLEPEELLRGIGYRLMDLNGDGVPELLIGRVADENEDPAQKSLILGGYSLVDGNPEQFLDGWSRNRHAIMQGNRIYNSGSGGAAYSAFGVFHLSEDGKNLVCEDFWFTDDVKDFMDPSYDNAPKLLYYHNQIGSWETKDSEELKITDEEFWALSEELETQIIPAELTPFAEYEPIHRIAAAGLLRAEFLEDSGLEEGSYENELKEYPDIFNAETYDAMIVFRVKEKVKEFRVLTLELQDVDENGHATFDTELLLELYTLKPDDPIAVPMSFPGDIPTNGISYLDENGEPLLFTVSLSGRDGSLVLTPIS